MPNVAGVQFPYTPQGQEAAQLYERSLSPAQGLGFRPLRMQEGGSPEHENALLYIKWAHGEGSDSLPKQFQINDLNSLAELMVLMENNPEAAIKYKDNLQRAIETPVSEGIAPPTTAEEVAFGATAGTGAVGESNPIIAAADEQIAQNMNPLVATGLGRAVGSEALRERAMNPLVATGLGRQQALREMTNNTLSLAEEARNQAGTGPAPYLGVPQGMRHGGVPRGTVAGELEPRGYLTARQAGETMRERAKGLRGQRNYGGGIGSLYNRHG